MKLSDYAKKAGISYRTAWKWWKQGILTGYQSPTGTIIILTEKIIERIGSKTWLFKATRF
uniref:hypothetical protein n=1 Tax=Cyanothece sp. BG0011 TaxID=2082950 RepID=UPI0018E58D0B|nr:hypothetical protein [Cyanothece sp. BG0011]